MDACTNAAPLALGAPVIGQSGSLGYIVDISEAPRNVYMIGAAGLVKDRYSYRVAFPSQFVEGGETE